MSIATDILGLTYRHLLKPILFRLDPEAVHNYFSDLGALLGASKLGRGLLGGILNSAHPQLEQKLFDLTFKNPVGLAAGFDKHGKLINILSSLGFGFAEIGSITAKPYQGNPYPRLVRLKKSLGLVVNYGLYNQGVENFYQVLSNQNKQDMILGVSIARTNSKSAAGVADGVADYINSLTYLEKRLQEELESELVGKYMPDYYTINISCPNTYGGEPYTTPEKLDQLLNAIMQLDLHRPIFVKLPLDLDWAQQKELLDVILSYQITGVIIANLTKSRESSLLKDTEAYTYKGGISGKPTYELSNELISLTYNYCGPKLAIIGLGGIFSAQDAFEKILRGASLVQLITGMIFRGPQLIAEINRGLVDLVNKSGYESILQVVGRYHN